MTNMVHFEIHIMLYTKAKLVPVSRFEIRIPKARFDVRAYTVPKRELGSKEAHAH